MLIREGGFGIPSLSKSATPMIRVASKVKFLIGRQRLCDRILNSMKGCLLESRKKFVKKLYGSSKPDIVVKLYDLSANISVSLTCVTLSKSELLSEKSKV